MTTTYQGGVRVKKLNSDPSPSVTINADLEATAAATADATNPDGYFLCTVVTTAGVEKTVKVAFTDV